MGLAVGLAVGVAAGLLAAPMRGSTLRASLRSRADDLRDRGLHLLDEGRRAFNHRGVTGTAPEALTATLGEIATTHPGAEPFSAEAQL
jgi:gas vesicle protein